MQPIDFITKWESATLKERSAAQEHFLDLCRLLHEPTPAEADPHGTWYCFEKGTKKAGGGDGWADVWKRGCFAWEYKSKGKDLKVAFKQLQLYAPALEHPPLLIVSDIDTIIIHTAFTGMVPEVHTIPLVELNHPERLQLLKWAFAAPERLKPKQTTQQLTEAAATEFADLAQQLRERGHDPQQVAHFLNKILFCLFAEDAELLPNKYFSRLLANAAKAPQHINAMLNGLFQTMSTGGVFGLDTIEWFNGGLFDSTATLPLKFIDIRALIKLAEFDWSAMEPSIFGTLFERGLDPDKRSQLGAHFTDPNSIMRLITPVIVEPLQAEWSKVKQEIAVILATDKPTVKILKQAELLYQNFLQRLAQFRVLDPACGSGNFLYLALRALKDLEQQVLLEAETLGLTRNFPQVGPEVVQGIEINIYAAELARVVVWIGEIQWMLQHGYDLNRTPILRQLNTVEQRDAILNADGSEPDWPAVDAIVGNPPFLGDKRMLAELGEEYVNKLRSLYKGRVPGGADLVTYWFERARTEIAQGTAQRAGLVATNSIRGGANRKVLERINHSSKIFNAWADEPWINNGAAVRISLVCFGKYDAPLMLNGDPVTSIYTDLTAQIHANSAKNDLTQAKPLKENTGISFIGIQPSGQFDISGDVSRQWLLSPNPHEKPNSEVLRPSCNGLDIMRRNRDQWIIDFGVNLSESETALYEIPYHYIVNNVKMVIENKISIWKLEKRNTQHLERQYETWWQHWCARPDMRKALNGLSRFIVTPRVAKYRLFVWQPVIVLPDSALVVIARTDNTTFGILNSRFHELWALRMGTSLEDRPRYTPTTTFETFPFPSGVLTTPNPDTQFPAIAEAARRLNELRENWLNPPEWIKREPEIVPGYPERIIPKPNHETELKKRTLTNLYNQRPTWLINAHRILDAAVAQAYGWSNDITDDEILKRLLELNLKRAKN